MHGNYDREIVKYRCDADDCEEDADYVAVHVIQMVTCKRRWKYYYCLKHRNAFMERPGKSLKRINYRQTVKVRA
jgi:hypothetical protein